MPTNPAIWAEVDRLRALFEAAGATRVDADILQPAETLLDLYGEDVRARAFTTADPIRGEAMLRPDFTVPVTLAHLANGSGPARYTYAGEVFRKQEDGGDRPQEYVQVGYEVFNAPNPAEADAEVFTMFAKALAPLNLRISTGDISLLRDAVSGLSAPAARKAALMRHLWRPRKFRAVLDSFAKPPAKDPLKALPDEMEEIGVRTLDDVAARLDAITKDRTTTPIPESEVELIEALLAVRETVPDALPRLQDLAVDLPAISDAVTRLEARFDKIAAAGIDLATLNFETSYGRTTLEYYDGFVFGFSVKRRPDLPPVASGGRYDALTRALSGGDTVPAVGGIIRPALTLELAS